MIPCLIAQPSPTKSQSERPRANPTNRFSNDAIKGWEAGSDDEDRYVGKLILLMFLVLVLPALVMLLSIIIKPDLFQINITP